MKISKQLFRAAAPMIVAAALLAPKPVLSATQGTPGATSTGSVDVNVTVPSLARISALNDISLGPWSGTGGMSGGDDLCVWTTTGGYNVTATGSGAAGAFTLASGLNTLAYTVQWADVAGAVSGSAVTSGVALIGQTAAATTTDCNGGVSLDATVLVDIAEAALAGAADGAYTGTLTLVVAPE